MDSYAKILKGWRFTSDEVYQLMEATNYKWEDDFEIIDSYDCEEQYFGITPIAVNEGCGEEINLMECLGAPLNEDTIAALRADCVSAGILRHEVFQEPKLYLLYCAYY